MIAPGLGVALTISRTTLVRSLLRDTDVPPRPEGELEALCEKQNGTNTTCRFNGELAHNPPDPRSEPERLTGDSAGHHGCREDEADAAG